MTPEHRATLTRLLAIVEAGGYVYPADARDALRTVLAVPEAGEGGAWESVGDFADREAFVATTHGVSGRREMIERRDAQTAMRLESMTGEGLAAQVRAFIRDLRGLR